MNANRQRVDRIADGLKRHDSEVYRQQFAPDLVVRAPAVAPTGLDARVKWVQGLVEAFPDGRAVVTGVFSDGDRVCAELVFEGTHTGPVVSPSGVVPPTNRAVRFPYCLVLRVEGEVAELLEYFDQLRLMAQLGLPAQA